MLGGKSMSDGCGLLRTCCQRITPNQMVSNEFIPTSDDYSPMMPDLSSVYRPNPLGYMLPQSKPNSYQKQTSYFNPTVRPLPFYQNQRPYRPPKLVNLPSMMEPMIETPLPVPVRNDVSYQNIASFAYDKCGSRQSVGINGRVQNLNYHESSTEFGEFPWQVAILKKLGPSDNLYACGGALISSKFVLTAAHCIKKYVTQHLQLVNICD